MHPPPSFPPLCMLMLMSFEDTFHKPFFTLVMMLVLEVHLVGVGGVVFNL